MASLIKKLAGETVIYGISHMLSRILFFVVLTPYLTDKLNDDTAEYGVYSELYSYSTILLTILIFRLDTALFRFGSKGEVNKVLGAAVIPMILLAAFAVMIGHLFDQSIASALFYYESPHYIRWFIYIICLDSFASMIYAKLRLESKPYKFLFYKLGNVVLTIILILLFLDILPSTAPIFLTDLTSSLQLSRKVDFVFLANLIASAATLLFMASELITIKINWDKELVKKMMWYAAPLVVVGIAGNVNQTFSTPIQKYFLGESVTENLAGAGIYAAAAKLAILLQLFTTAFNYAAEPFFFNNADRSDVGDIYGKVALMYTIVACLGTICIVGFLDIVIYLLGESYRVGAPVVPILLFAYIFLGLYYNVGIWYKLKDKTYLGAIVSTVGMIITIIISLIFLPKIGTIASAYAALVCYIVMVVICYQLGKKYFPVKYPKVRISSYISISAAICWSLLNYKGEMSSLQYYPLLVLLIAVFVGFAWKYDVKRAIA